MGTELETLGDLLRPSLRAICIGVNPAPTSVAVGHYYQGSAGRRILSRLRAAGLLPPPDDLWEDDLAFELGIGQTDVVKRSTPKAEQIRADEFQYGKRALEARLAAVRADLVLFTFKKAATVLYGEFAGHGFVPGLTLCGGKVFVMPGPYEKAEVARNSISVLARWVERHIS
jgi:TDG/mug DNA glycosylase family protein